MLIVSNHLLHFPSILPISLPASYRYYRMYIMYSSPPPPPLVLAFPFFLIFPIVDIIRLQFFLAFLILLRCICSKYSLYLNYSCIPPSIFWHFFHIINERIYFVVLSFLGCYIPSSKWKTLLFSCEGNLYQILRIRLWAREGKYGRGFMYRYRKEYFLVLSFVDSILRYMVPNSRYSSLGTMYSRFNTMENGAAT